jgi:alanyl-tRNA synthetase
MRNHTATHLLHRALRNVVGPEAHQAGSLVAPDYLRFDYPMDRPLTAAEKRAIEDEVRRIVRENRSVTTVVQPMAAAIAAGADALFDEKYGERVRTVRVEGYSLELCGGTHCSASGQIGGFVITADRSIGAGTRRIEAMTGDGADALLRERTELLERIAETVGATSVDAASPLPPSWSPGPRKWLPESSWSPILEPLIRPSSGRASSRKSGPRWVRA